MRPNLSITAALALILGLSVAYAQEQKPAPEQKAPMGHGMMMMDDAMKAQMSRMMENCNKMMESRMQQQPDKK